MEEVWACTGACLEACKKASLVEVGEEDVSWEVVCTEASWVVAALAYIEAWVVHILQFVAAGAKPKTEV